MPVSTDYIARETFSNLWRNRLMTIAAVLTIAVSLSLVGATLLLKQGAAQATGEWQRGVEVIVWMKPTASQSEITAIHTQLNTLSYVNQPCTFWTHEMDFDEAKKTVGPVITIANVHATTIPTSWRCVPKHLQDATQIVAKFVDQPGVTSVGSPTAQIRTEEKVIDWLQWIFVIIAVVLLLSAAVLILNTIRMAIFARRREVSVMKLVGATNWFIRLPFMAEGLVQGLIGSLFAALMVFVLHIILNDAANPAHPTSIIAQMRLSTWQVFWTDFVVVAVGVIVGTVGSAIAIRRFLDV